MIQISDGGFALAGDTRAYGTENKNFWLLKTNAEGDSLWSHEFGGEASDWCRDVIETSDGRIAMAGLGGTFQKGYFSLVMISAEGDSLWSRWYGIGGFDECRSIIETSDGGFSLAGRTKFFGRDDEFWLLQTDQSGDSLWSRPFPLGHTMCNSHIQTADGRFALAGINNDGIDNSSDFLLLETGIDPMSVSHPSFVAFPSSFSLSAYPNPFNGVVNLSFQTTRPGYYALEMIDPSGRSVGKLFDGFAGAGERKVTWNAAGMAAGEYFIRLDGGQGGSAVKPVVLVK